MYIYGGFTLLYGRNQHNIVKQLSSNFKKKKKRKIKTALNSILAHQGSGSPSLHKHKTKFFSSCS